jgi:hypothetical protein
MSTTTHADAAVTVLKDTARSAYRASFEAGSHFARRHSDVQQATDVVDVMARTIDLLAAAEALHGAADNAVKAIRINLAEQMDATGATRIEATHHTAMLAKKPAFLSIADENLIPREYFVQPPPRLDNSAVKSALKDGQQVPGVSLAIPNEMVLRLVAKKEPAQ